MYCIYTSFLISIGKVERKISICFFRDARYKEMNSSYSNCKKCMIRFIVICPNGRISRFHRYRTKNECFRDPRVTIRRWLRELAKQKGVWLTARMWRDTAGSTSWYFKYSILSATTVKGVGLRPFWVADVANLHDLHSANSSDGR